MSSDGRTEALLAAAGELRDALAPTRGVIVFGRGCLRLEVFDAMGAEEAERVRAIVVDVALNRGVTVELKVRDANE